MTQPPPPYDPYQQPPPAQPAQPYPAQGYPPSGYPPQQAPYGYQQPPPPKPVSPRLAFWTSGQGIVVIFVIAGAAFLLLFGVIRAVEGPASAAFDVNVTSCEVTGSTNLATAKVGLTVKNTSKTTKSATVKVEYRDGGGSRIDTDTAYVRSIAPGDTVRVEESTLLDAAPAGSMRCEIVGVS